MLILDGAQRNPGSYEENSLGAHADNFEMGSI